MRVEQCVDLGRQGLANLVVGRPFVALARRCALLLAVLLVALETLRVARLLGAEHAKRWDRKWRRELDRAFAVRRRYLGDLWLWAAAFRRRALAFPGRARLLGRDVRGWFLGRGLRCRTLDATLDQRAGTLLDRVRELVGKQLATAGRAGLVAPSAEVDVLAVRERLGLNVARSGARGRIVVQTHGAEVAAQARLEEAAVGGRQRLAAALLGLDRARGGRCDRRHGARRGLGPDEQLVALALRQLGLARRLRRLGHGRGGRFGRRRGRHGRGRRLGRGSGRLDHHRGRLGRRRRLGRRAGRTLRRGRTRRWLLLVVVLGAAAQRALA